MPTRRPGDAHRALELLEEYHSQLHRPGEKPLRSAIERVIRIFKSRLFQALLDLQEFYEETLLDEQKSTQQKTVETLQIASRWELDPPIVASQPPPEPQQQLSVDMTDEPLPSPPTEILPPPVPEPIYQRPNKSSMRSDPSAQSVLGSSRTLQQHSLAAYTGPSSEPTMSSPSCAADDVYQTISLAETASPQQVNGSGQWQFEEIALERGDAGLGFSIAGGTDNTNTNGDTGIYITKLIEGGAALTDGRLRLNDVIVSVNGVSTENVAHAQAVDALKRAGRNVLLLVKRQRLTADDTIIRVELLKTEKGLGFSIAGGIGNQHIQGDNGIFITKIIEGGTAHLDGRLSAGDRILAVNDITMENVLHEHAVATLKAAKDCVSLLVAKTSNDGSPLHLTTTGVSTVVHDNSFDSLNCQRVECKTLPRSLVSPMATPQSYQSATLPRMGMGGGGENHLTLAPRRILLKKSAAGFGFNIVGGEDDEGIFVSFILAGGPADIGGELRKGDQLLSVNGIDLREATHEQAAGVLKSVGDFVEIVAQYQPDEYSRFEAKIRDLREQMLQTTGNGGSNIKMAPKMGKFVRALFDYDPTSDAGLPGRGLEFKYGHVLNVVGDDDSDWWHAVRVMPDDGASGVIPSKHRIERRERARVQMNRTYGKSPDRKGTLEKKKRTLLGTKLPFVRSKYLGWGEDTLSSEDGSEDTVMSYETVVQRELKYTRPVVVLGPLKDRINDDLIAEFPEKFGSCVPHTTRPPRDDEVDGRDYHFTTRDQMERDIESHLFIEAGQYCGNLYGTSIKSVKEVAEQGKHCILDVSGNAIKRLQTASLFPVAIFVKPQSVDMIMQWNRKTPEDQARKTYDRALKLENEFTEFFTAIVSGDTADDVYARVKEVIRDHSGLTVWIPQRDN